MIVCPGGIELRSRLIDSGTLSIQVWHNAKTLKYWGMVYDYRGCRLKKSPLFSSLDEVMVWFDFFEDDYHGVLDG